MKTNKGANQIGEASNVIASIAEQSTNSAKSINEVVNTLQDNSKAVVETMGKVSAISKEQTNRVVNSREKYMLIAEVIKESEKAVEKLNVLGDRIGVMKNDIVDTL